MGDSTNEREDDDRLPAAEGSADIPAQPTSYTGEEAPRGSTDTPDPTPSSEQDEPEPVPGTVLEGESQSAAGPTEPSIESLAPAPSWTQTFAGILFQPHFTLERLDRAEEHFSKLRNDSFKCVFLVFAVIGLVIYNPSSALVSVVQFISAILNGMIFWVLLALAMTSLSNLDGCRHASWSKALVMTGWAFAPLIFLAPLSCYRLALGPMFPLVAAIPVMWALFLGLLSFHNTLSISMVRLLLFWMVLPPILMLVYVFWLGCLVALACAGAISAATG